MLKKVVTVTVELGATKKQFDCTIKEAKALDAVLSNPSKVIVEFPNEPGWKYLKHSIFKYHIGEPHEPVETKPSVEKPVKPSDTTLPKEHVKKSKKNKSVVEASKPTGDTIDDLP